MRIWIGLCCCAVLGLSTLVGAGEPATKPSDQVQAADKNDPFNGIDNATIRLPDGREVNLADLQRDGMPGLMVMKSVGMGNHSTVLVTDEQGRKIKITEEDNEIVVTIKEGDNEPVEYRAGNAEELKANHPEAFEVYEKFATPDVMIAGPGGPGAGMMDQRMQIRLGGPDAHVLKIDALGATCRPVVDAFVKSQLGDGVVVIMVEPDSLGEKLGLQRHDLIKSINAKPVESPQQLQDALDSADKLQLGVVRAGKSIMLEEK